MKTSTLRPGFGPALLAALLPLAARAQAPLTPSNVTTATPNPPGAYEVEYDSLMRRAARVRARTDRAITSFRHSFLALGGTNRRTYCYATIARQNKLNADALSPMVYSRAPSVMQRLVKKHIIKHKTTVAQVERVFYYNLSGQLVLSEQYENGRSVRLWLDEYNLAQKAVRLRRTEWVRGSYLSVVQQSDGPNAATRRAYLVAPRPAN